MTSTTTTPGTAVAAPKPERQLSPAAAEARAIRQIVTQIKGQIWGDDVSPELQHAVARYALKYNIDAVRHIDILGGKIYLNGEYYEERGVPFVLDGTVTVFEPNFVHADPRLQAMVDSGDEHQAAWAKQEIFRRMRERIEFGIPDDATGACIYRCKIGDTVLAGFNWCGGSSKVKTKRNGEQYRGDPIGDAEPVKTAQSRAKRRMWKQIIAVSPQVSAAVAGPEAGLIEANAEISAIARVEAEQTEKPHPTVLLTHGEDPYATGAEAAADAAPLAEGVTSDGEQVAAARTAEDEAFEKRLAEDDAR